MDDDKGSWKENKIVLLSSIYILHRTNIAENQWLEDENFLLGRPIFRGYVSFRQGSGY